MTPGEGPQSAQMSPHGLWMQWNRCGKAALVSTKENGMAGVSVVNSVAHRGVARLVPTVTM